MATKSFPSSQDPPKPDTLWQVTPRKDAFKPLED
jgi:hypothetical protein